MKSPSDINKFEDTANKLQSVINELLSAPPLSPQHQALCDDQFDYLAQKRDILIAQIYNTEHYC